jgi:hypothetical protein
LTDDYLWKPGLVRLLVRMVSLTRGPDIHPSTHSISATMISRLMLNLHDASNRRSDVQALSDVEIETLQSHDADRP